MFETLGPLGFSPSITYIRDYLDFPMDWDFPIAWYSMSAGLTLWRPLGHICPTRIDLWPDPISLPRLSWTARNRHTVTCMHQFSHILRWPPEPAVWFMSNWRAVSIEQARTYADLLIISSSFEMARIVEGLRHWKPNEPTYSTVLSTFIKINQIDHFEFE